MRYQNKTHSRGPTEFDFVAPCAAIETTDREIGIPIFFDSTECIIEFSLRIWFGDVFPQMRDPKCLKTQKGNQPKSTTKWFEERTSKVGTGLKLIRWTDFINCNWTVLHRYGYLEQIQLPTRSGWPKTLVEWWVVLVRNHLILNGPHCSFVTQISQQFQLSKASNSPKR